MQPMRKFVFTALVISAGGCERHSAPTNYDDCIFANIRGVENKDAVAAIKSSCVGKFLPAFNWDEIAREAKVTPWSVINGDDFYKKLSKDEQRAVKKDYWQRVLESNIRVEFREAARTEFISHG